MNEAFKNLMLFYSMDAPEGYTHAAVDSSGEVYLYKCKPFVCSSRDEVQQWKYEGNDADNTKHSHRQVATLTIPRDINWKETLIEL